MDRSLSALFTLLKSSLGASCTGEELALLSGDEWNRLIDVAFAQGVAPLTGDGYNELGVGSAIDSEEFDDIRYEWLSSVFHAEMDYDGKLGLAARFAAALEKRGVSCYVLKGLSYGTYYPCPEHRESGDCDIYLGSGFELGNEVAVKLGGQYEFGTYKHSHLFFGDVMFENHRYLTDFNATRQGKKIELILERAISEAPGRRIADTPLLCPNDHFNALFLIKHAHGNFICEGLVLRMIYDWAALIDRCQDSLDWQRLYSDLTECRLREFSRLMTSLCTEYFGIGLRNPGIELCGDSALVEEVMMDTVSREVNNVATEGFLHKCFRILRRFRRIWHYRKLSTESVPRMIWNSFAFSSYMHRKIEM